MQIGSCSKCTHFCISAPTTALQNGEKAMNYATYNGGLTAEQFLFHEIRTTARLILDGKSPEEAICTIRTENLFQYPTEREISRIARACFKRLDALENPQLVHELAYAPVGIAKQINLYAMMRHNRVVWDFMVQVIGEKYLDQDFSFSKKDGFSLEALKQGSSFCGAVFFVQGVWRMRRPSQRIWQGSERLRPVS